LLHLAWILPLALLIAYLYSPRFRGEIAESRVRRILAAGLEKSRYTVFNDLLIPSGGGTSRIDHLVVARTGIFVIESQYARGRIAGTAAQERWKRRLGRRSLRMENPVHRNRVHAEAVQRLLDYPGRVFQPLVVLVGASGFEPGVPDNVLTPERLLERLRRNPGELLTPEQANHAIRTIDATRLRTRSGWPPDRWALLRWLLLAVLLAGIWLAYRDDFSRLLADMQQRSERAESPESFHPDGSRKTERELWEDSLVCAYSADTGRCSCYGPDGAPVAGMDPSECRELAERGSILRQ
jgi:hypothetical protein